MADIVQLLKSTPVIAPFFEVFKGKFANYTPYLISRLSDKQAFIDSLRTLSTKFGEVYVTITNQVEINNLIKQSLIEAEIDYRDEGEQPLAQFQAAIADDKKASLIFKKLVEKIKKPQEQLEGIISTDCLNSVGQRVSTTKYSPEGFLGYFIGLLFLAMRFSADNVAFIIDSEIKNSPMTDPGAALMQQQQAAIRRPPMA